MSLVSVIIPTYNRAALLRQAVESVLAQTYGDLEVIVVDDGSTDDTAAVMSAFGDGRMRYVIQEHAERSVARNLGLSLARGEYIAFLDDDDVYLPHRLAVHVAFLEANPDVDLVASGYRLVDADRDLLSVQRPWLRHSALNLETCVMGWFPTMMVATIRARALVGISPWFDAAMVPAEDMDFFVRLAIAGCRMTWFPGVVAEYRAWRPPSIEQIAEAHRSRVRVVERALDDPHLPEELRSQGGSIWARMALAGAWRAYTVGQLGRARYHLLSAIALYPRLASEPDAVTESLACYVTSLRDVGNCAEDVDAFASWVVEDVETQLGLSLAHAIVPDEPVYESRRTRPDGPAGAGVAAGSSTARQSECSA